VTAAVVVPFPSVAPPIGGLPAHVTVLFPFPEPTPDVVSATRDVFAGVRAFDVAFREVREFPGVVYLAPEPAEPFVALTEALERRFPAWQPYGGEFDELIPHLTIAADEPPPPLPAHARAAEAVLFVEVEPDVWEPHTTFPFEGES
jgi:hypothetical protein